MPKPRGKSEKPQPKAKLRISSLLDLSRPEGGNNRAVLGMMSNAIRRERVKLPDIDVDDWEATVAKLAKSKSERVKLRLAEMLLQAMKANNEFILKAERVAQGERDSEWRRVVREGSNEVPDDAPAGPEPLVIQHEARPVPLPPGPKRG